MKASELIKQLAIAIDKWGDLEVYNTNPDWEPVWGVDLEDLLDIDGKGYIEIGI